MEDQEQKPAPLPGTPHRLLQYFAYEGSPEPLRSVLMPFANLARGISVQLPNNCERDECLRQLLAARDAAIRCVVYREPSALTLV